GMTASGSGVIFEVRPEEVPMRNNRKRAGLFLALLIGAIALVSWCRRDRTGEVSTPMSANNVVSTSTASPRGSGTDTEPHAQAAPEAELPPGGAAQSVAEAPKSAGEEVAHATRGGAQAKAAAPSK